MDSTKTTNQESRNTTGMVMVVNGRTLCPADVSIYVFNA